MMVMGYENIRLSLQQLKITNLFLGEQGSGATAAANSL